MNALQKAALAASVLLSSSTALAVPMHPDDGSLPGLPNTADLLEQFELYVDSDPAVHVIYYIPKAGTVGVDAPRSSEPRPRFSVNHRYQTRGYFATEVLSYVGGSLSTNGSLGALRQLESAAASVGYRIAPAPVEKVATRFAIASRAVVEDADGQLRIDVKCKQVPGGTRADGTPFMVDECATKSDPDGTTYDLGAEVMYRFMALPYAGSSIGGRIPFQGITVPGWDEVIDQKLQSGDAWDNILTSQVEWQLTGNRRTHKALLHVNWQSLFEQASAFAALHIGGCVDVEIEGFFQNIATCEGTAEKCGVSIEWFDAAGKSTPIPSNDAAFVNAVTEIQKALQDELFAQVRPDSSVLGRVRRDTNAFFTLRANYEKRSMSRNETIPVYWNPGSKSITASTTLNIDCVQGTAGSRLFWADTAYCRDLLGTTADP